jgi:hypothetical protein
MFLIAVERGLVATGDVGALKLCVKEGRLELVTPGKRSGESLPLLSPQLKAPCCSNKTKNV